jgi:hypothetical protein
MGEGKTMREAINDLEEVMLYQRMAFGQTDKQILHHPLIRSLSADSPLTINGWPSA